MKVFYIGKTSYSKFILNSLNKVDLPDLIIFGEDVFEEINFNKELNEESLVCNELAKFSKEYNSSIMVRVKTIVNDIAYTSCLVFEKGTFLGVCDEVLLNENGGGVTVNFYDLHFGRSCILINSNANQIEFLQLGEALNCNLFILFSDEENLKLTKNVAYYVSKKNKTKCVVLSYDKMWIYSEDKEEVVSLSESVSYSSFLLKNTPKNKNFLKHIHNLIYSNLS